MIAHKKKKNTMENLKFLKPKKKIFSFKRIIIS